MSNDQQFRVIGYHSAILLSHNEPSTRIRNYIHAKQWYFWSHPFPVISIWHSYISYDTLIHYSGLMDMYCRVFAKRMPPGNTTHHETLTDCESHYIAGVTLKRILWWSLIWPSMAIVKITINLSTCLLNGNHWRRLMIHHWKNTCNWHILLRIQSRYQIKCC